MRLHFPALLLAGLLVAIPFGPAGAQDSAPASAAPVPDQAWYPPGYLELRQIAAVHVETIPRDRAWVLIDWGDGSGLSYGVVDCEIGQDLPDGMDYDEVQLAALALDIARMRSELRELDYRQDVYDGPLLDYERAALADIEVRRTERLRDPENHPIYPQYRYDAEPNFELLGELARDMESRRRRLQPEKWRIDGQNGCGSGYGPFTIELVPGNGRLWLINAFAFRVCERKVPNPWDHQACGWTEYVTGDDTMATGRYMYEVRWPGGAVQRGARLLQPDMSDYENGEVVVFRRD